MTELKEGKKYRVTHKNLPAPLEAFYHGVIGVGHFFGDSGLQFCNGMTFTNKELAHAKIEEIEND